MSARILLARRALQSVVPHRRVQCACTPDLGQRPLVENKLLDVTEPASFSVPSTFTDTGAFSSETRLADEWLGATPLVSVRTAAGATLADRVEPSVRLLPKSTEEASEKKDEGLGAYLLQTAPVRYDSCLLSGLE
jgi:hypothetical protein